jgi:hypothetical protein
MPLSLSDDEYSAVLQAAGPIHLRQRDDFLRTLAAELFPALGLERHPANDASYALLNCSQVFWRGEMSTGPK